MRLMAESSNPAVFALHPPQYFSIALIPSVWIGPSRTQCTPFTPDSPSNSAFPNLFPEVHHESLYRSSASPVPLFELHEKTFDYGRHGES